MDWGYSLRQVVDNHRAEHDRLKDEEAALPPWAVFKRMRTRAKMDVHLDEMNKARKIMSNLSQGAVKWSD